VECFADGGDDWFAPAEFAGEITRVGDSAAGAGTDRRRIKDFTQWRREHRVHRGEEGRLENERGEQRTENGRIRLGGRR